MAVTSVHGVGTSARDAGSCASPKSTAGMAPSAMSIRSTLPNRPPVTAMKISVFSPISVQLAIGRRR